MADTKTVTPVTAGPWTPSARTFRTQTTSRRKWYCDVMAADGELVATAYGETPEEAEANAALLASAIDLQAALMVIRRRLHFVGHPGEPMTDGLLAPRVPDWRSEIRILEAALARSEGR